MSETTTGQYPRQPPFAVGSFTGERLSTNTSTPQVFLRYKSQLPHRGTAFCRIPRFSSTSPSFTFFRCQLHCPIFDFERDQDVAMGARLNASLSPLSHANDNVNDDACTPLRYKTNSSLLDDLLESETSLSEETPSSPRENMDRGSNQRKNFYSPVAYSILADFEFHPESSDQPRPQNPSPSQMECVVCLGTKVAQEFPQLPVSIHCAHAPQTCSSCVSSSIRSDLESKLLAEIRCPECQQRLEYMDVKRHADEETFVR